MAEFESDYVRVARWVDIYEADNVTMWRSQVPITGGSVSIDMSRDERRNLDLVIADPDGDLGYGPGYFWYDKIIKPYRGVTLQNGDIWVAPLGEFMIDQIQRPHFPSEIQVTGRDFMKKLLGDRFSQTTTFVAGTNVVAAIKAICTNAGITKFNFPTIDVRTLTSPVTFERNTERGRAALDLAESISSELFFDASGRLTLRPYVDPLTAPLSYTFQTGDPLNPSGTRWAVGTIEGLSFSLTTEDEDFLLTETGDVIMAESSTPSVASDAESHFLVAEDLDELMTEDFDNLVTEPSEEVVIGSATQTIYAYTNTGNLVSFTRSTADTLMNNHVVVYGDGPDNPLVFAEVENNDPSSPTRIAQLGRRTYSRSSVLVKNNADALLLAQSILKVRALEQYDVSLSSLVIPWLEAGDAIELLVDDAAVGDPTRFLLTSFGIPLGLEAMSASVKRITIVS